MLLEVDPYPITTLLLSAALLLAGVRFPPSGRDEEAAPAPRMERDTSTQLFVGNLPFTTDATSLGSMFTDYGVVDTKVIYDQQTGRSKGIAFVTFGSAEDAVKAQAAVNGAVRGRPGDVSPLPV